MSGRNGSGLAHQLGFPLPMKVMSRLWNWEKLWKEGAADSDGASTRKWRLLEKGRDKL